MITVGASAPRSTVWNRIGAPCAVGVGRGARSQQTRPGILPETALLAAPFASPPPTVFGLRGNAKRDFIYRSLAPRTRVLEPDWCSPVLWVGLGARSGLRFQVPRAPDRTVWNRIGAVNAVVSGKVRNGL